MFHGVHQALLARASHLHNHTPKHNNQPVLELAEPTEEKRRPDDQLPEEIVLDRPRIVIGPCLSCMDELPHTTTRSTDRPTQSHTAGRGLRADVRLVQGEGAQNTISRKHAQLRIEGNGAVKLEDLVCIYVCAWLADG